VQAVDAGAVSPAEPRQPDARVPERS